MIIRTIQNKKKQLLVTQIRRVGELFHEDSVWLERYIVEQVDLWSNKNRLEEAIECFKEVANAIQKEIKGICDKK